jgi:hypothetical protein
MYRYTKAREHRHRDYHFKKTPTTPAEITEPFVVERHSSPVHVVLVRINVIRPLCAVVLGKKHSTFHRLLAGFLVAAMGVLIAKHAGAFHNVYIEHIGDGVGYALHGMGLVPFIEFLSEHVE